MLHVGIMKTYPKCLGMLHGMAHHSLFLDISVSHFSNNAGTCACAGTVHCPYIAIYVYSSGNLIALNPCHFVTQEDSQTQGN